MTTKSQLQGRPLRAFKWHLQLSTSVHLDPLVCFIWSLMSIARLVLKWISIGFNCSTHGTTKCDKTGSLIETMQCNEYKLQLIYLILRFGGVQCWLLWSEYALPPPEMCFHQKKETNPIKWIESQLTKSVWLSEWKTSEQRRDVKTQNQNIYIFVTEANWVWWRGLW